MLDDFVDDLKGTLQQRLDNAFQVLKGNVDPAKPRGLIEAYETVLVDIDELRTRYTLPESAPDQLRMGAEGESLTPAGSARRLYGRAAA